MQKVVLSEISLIHGDVKTPKGYEINRTKIKNIILDSYVNEDRISNNKLDYSYNDYKVTYCQELQWLKDYIRDHYQLEHHYSLIPKIDFGTVLTPNERSYIRNNVDPVDLKNAPDYTCVYGVDVNSDCDLVIEYNDNRRAGRTWHVPLKNNRYYIFPSTQRYFFTANKSSKLNIILTSTYEYI
jgi:hypothetical protein